MLRINNLIDDVGKDQSVRQLRRARFDLQPDYRHYILEGCETGGDITGSRDDR